ncbi:rod shape-determining protein [Streptomyces sp. NPDC056254]|uniref:rod shape-determining protein n=1 Tax=Streptomyces sp. NPDC056254 TaxID=3345763 RepID=UPI0035D7199F
MSFIGCDMAVDLGTTNTQVYQRGQGIVLNEPSVVTVNTSTGGITAVGREAKNMIGREPRGVVAVRPLRNGVVADFESAEPMLRYFIRKVHRRRWASRPRVLVCVPCGVTGIERRALIEASIQAGARQVHVIDAPLAAAIGANLPVHEATGSMVVDIGGGTTQVAVISFADVIIGQSIRVAGDVLDDAIIQHVKNKYSLLLGERTAEEIKITIGQAWGLKQKESIEIRGRALTSGLPEAAFISAADIRQALEGPVNAIIAAVKCALGDCPSELSGDLMVRGLVLTGGGALLHGLGTRLRHETGMPVHTADRPLESVALGAGKCVEEFHALQKVLASRSYR